MKKCLASHCEGMSTSTWNSSAKMSVSGMQEKNTAALAASYDSPCNWVNARKILMPTVYATKLCAVNIPIIKQSVQKPMLLYSEECRDILTQRATA